MYPVQEKERNQEYRYPTRTGNQPNSSVVERNNSNKKTISLFHASIGILSLVQVIATIVIFITEKDSPCMSSFVACLVLCFVTGILICIQKLMMYIYSTGMYSTEFQILLAIMMLTVIVWASAVCNNHPTCKETGPAIYYLAGSYGIYYLVIFGLCALYIILLWTAIIKKNDEPINQETRGVRFADPISNV
jgi:hypothetical protein